MDELGVIQTNIHEWYASFPFWRSILSLLTTCRPPPLLKSDQIGFLVQKDAQCSKTCLWHFFYEKKKIVEKNLDKIFFIEFFSHFFRIFWNVFWSSHIFLDQKPNFATFKRGWEGGRGVCVSLTRSSFCLLRHLCLLPLNWRATDGGTPLGP